MRIIFALVLFVGVAIAGGAVYLAMERFNQYESALANSKGKTTKQVKMATLYVAAKDLKYGTQLSKDDVREVQFPINAMPEKVFAKQEDLLGSEGESDARTVILAMEKGEVILPSKVTGLGEDAGVASRLEAGMRAFAIRVDVASGVSGFLRPGDKVDVYWTGSNDRGSVTKLILNGLTLIAIDQQADSKANRPTVARTVTVAAKPKTIAALVQAQASGNLLLSLRGIDDDTTSEQIEVTNEDLLGNQRVVAVEEKVCTIKTRKGGEVLQIPIPCSN